MRERSWVPVPRKAPKKRASVPVARGPVPRKAPQPPLHIKVLSDLWPVLFLISIDIKVFQTFSPRAQAAPILHILTILTILLQTVERWRGTGPRPTAATQHSATGPADLNVYRTSAQQAEKVREALNRYSRAAAL